jgi:hypothetical protein
MTEKHISVGEPKLLVVVEVRVLVVVVVVDGKALDAQSGLLKPTAPLPLL